MTKKQITILIVVFLIGLACCRFLAAAEISGPVSVQPGFPAVFELPQKAVWTVTPVDLAADKVLVDSGGTRIFFASPVEGTFTIVAAFLDEGEIVQTTHVFAVSVKDVVPNPEPKPEPTPLPPVDLTMVEWVAKNAPQSDFAKLQKVATLYASYASGIERGTIRTPDGVYNGLRKGIQPIATTKDWQDFMKELDAKLQDDIAERMKTMTCTVPGQCELQALKLSLNEIAKGMKQ